MSRTPRSTVLSLRESVQKTPIRKAWMPRRVRNIPPFRWDTSAGSTSTRSTVGKTTTPQHGPETEASPPIHLLIIGSHNLVRQGLRALFRSAQDIAVVGDAESGQSALKQIGNLSVDVLLVDLQTAGIEEIATIRQLFAKHPRIRILLVATSHEETAVLAAIREGAHGYLPQDADLETCLEAVRTVCQGEFAFPDSWTQKLLGQAMNQRHSYFEGEKLTQRELEILRLLASGLEDREIAKKLSISQGTVRTHVSNLLPKLGSKNRVEATRWALRHGVAALGQATAKDLYFAKNL